MVRFILGQHFADFYDQLSWHSAYEPGIEIGDGDDDGINLLVHIENGTRDLFHIRVHPTESGNPPQFASWGQNRLVVLVGETVTIIDIPQRAIVAEHDLHFPLDSALVVNGKLLIIGELSFLLLGEDLAVLESQAFIDVLANYFLLGDHKVKLELEDGTEIVLNCS